MQKKDIKPKFEKKTTISFPLIKPEPMIVPIMARDASNTFIKYFILNM